MATVFITKGLPASGKSTWAKKQVLENGYKRVNRDDLREMIDCGKWSKENERLIVQIRNLVISTALLNKQSVIVDDTNLHHKNVQEIEKIASDFSATVKIVDFTDVPLDECLKRDQKRPNYVGEKVIKKMYNQFLSKPTPRVPAPADSKLPPAWIFDIDGTLALHNRSPFDYASLGNDTVNESVRTILNCLYALPEPRDIFIVSGRPDSVRTETKCWLEDNKIGYTGLFMRRADDRRSDDIVKLEIFLKYFDGKYQIMGVFDDRLRVCRVWHDLGLPLFKVGDPDADF